MDGNISVMSNPKNVKIIVNPETVVTIKINAQCSKKLIAPTTAITLN